MGVIKIILLVITTLGKVLGFIKAEKTQKDIKNLDTKIQDNVKEEKKLDDNVTQAKEDIKKVDTQTAEKIKDVQTESIDELSKEFDAGRSK